METKTVGVVGAGTMGHGIAHVLVRSGYTVLLHDLSLPFLDSGAERVVKDLERDVEKNRLTEEEREKALSRLKTTTRVSDLGGADFIVEAVTEDFEAKAGAFRAIEPHCGQGVIFASNTSSISITRLASTTQRPDRFIGLHFFNPVAVMKLVEVVPGLQTSPETADKAVKLVESVGKTSVRVNDYPGFISNRLLMPMINEAVYCLMEGLADAKGIDDVMKLGMNHPMGPLELADLIGLDVCLDIMKVLYESFRDSKFRPCPLLEKMVNAGRLGRKTGQGFYQYSEEKV
ncbi:MAG: 3-hydroxyacyl-CoA dehydrogenase family protein [Terriglobia bacterium]